MRPKAESLGYLGAGAKTKAEAKAKGKDEMRGFFPFDKLRVSLTSKNKVRRGVRVG